MNDLLPGTLLLTPNEYLDLRESRYVTAEREGLISYDPAIKLVRVREARVLEPRP